MQIQSLLLSLLVGSSSAMTMHRPTFLLFRALDPVQVAINKAYIDAGIAGKPPSYCTSLIDIQMDQGALPPPSPGLTLYHIAVGRGTQNYTCPTSDESAAPQQLGAAATLYNVTCLMTPNNAAIVNTMFTSVVESDRPTTDLQVGSESGHHYFTNGNSTATFILHEGAGSWTGNLGITFSKKTSNVSAPSTALLGKGDNSKAVPWLKLATIGLTANPATPVVQIEQSDTMGHVQEIYRLNTAGGAAPPTCAGLAGTNFTKEYAAEYWFWH